jgi:fructose-1,6-bisphosphatase II
MTPSTLTAVSVDTEFGFHARIVGDALAATQAAALAAASWAGRGDPLAADEAATAAMRSVLGAAAKCGAVVTGEGAKDNAPMLADGEVIGCDGLNPTFDIAVDPLECTDLCARGLPGAMSTIAVAPRGSLWSPGPAFYMDKLVVPPGVRPATQITDPPEMILQDVASRLGKHIREMRVIVLEKPRHQELTARLRATGARVATPPAGDVAGALAVLLPDGDADLLLGVGGTPEGVLAACAARALGGGMQARIAPQREDERERVLAAGLSQDRVLELADLAAADGAFVATGITGGLLGAPRRHDAWVRTESLVIAQGAVRYVYQTNPTEE